MKNTYSLFICILAISLITISCSDSGHEGHNHEEHNHESHEGHDHEGHDHEGHNYESHEGHNHESHEHGEEEHGEHEEKVHLSMSQFKALKMDIGKITKRNMSSYISVNGHLEVAPQNQAAVTSVIGANVVSIEVIEGEEIKKGKILAYVSHPDLVNLQSDYVSAWNAYEYLETEFKRQEELYKEKVSSGKVFQKSKSDFQSAKALVYGLEAQLKIMGLNLNKLRNSEIQYKVPIISPIDGFVKDVEVKIGQFVAPQTDLFEIVDIKKVHGDFKVFESDMHKVSKGQKMKLYVESLPNVELEGTVYSVGKTFEENPKAIHIHVNIDNKQGLLIPGMYVRGKVILDDILSLALPEEAVVKEGDKSFVFLAEKDGDSWELEPMEVIVGKSDNGWLEIRLLKQLNENQLLALNSAYYLMAEMKKGEAEHSH